MKILLHVSGEIGTKGKNRIIFERKLAENIKKKIKDVKIKRAFGSFLLELDEKNKDKLLKIPGIAWIAEVVESEKNLNKLFLNVEEYLKKEKINVFDLEVKRQDKKIEKTSQEIRQELIKFLTNKNFIFKPKTNKIYLELNKEWWLVFSKKEKCIGGLPTGTSGKAIALISGGIDSAVASFLAMKKGLTITFVHFHNYPNNKYKAIDEKIIELVKILNDYQIESKIYIISFVKPQQEIIKAIKPKYRMLVYRLLMFKIAEKIAKKEKAEVLISGDSLGQVASQTLQNLKLIIKNLEFPLFMPLIGYNKDEIIDIAKKINTYNISIKNYADCCSFMIAKHPATKVSDKKFTEILKNLNIKKIIKESLERSNLRIEVIK